jgi:hypothetical protein
MTEDALFAHDGILREPVNSNVFGRNIVITCDPKILTLGVPLVPTETDIDVIDFFPIKLVRASENVYIVFARRNCFGTITMLDVSP